MFLKKENENQQKYMVYSSCIALYNTFLYLARYYKKLDMHKELHIEIKKAKSILEKMGFKKDSPLEDLQLILEFALEIEASLKEQQDHLAVEKIRNFCLLNEENYELWHANVQKYSSGVQVKCEKKNLTESKTSRLFKLCSQSKIDGKNEYVNLCSCVLFYSYFLEGIRSEEEATTNAQSILMNLNWAYAASDKWLIPYSKEGLPYTWLQECFHCANAVKEKMKKFLFCGDMEIYSEAIKDMRIFCRCHEADYEDWIIEVLKWMKGQERITRLIYVLLGIALGLSISLASLIYILKEYGQEMKEVEVEFFGDADLEDIYSLEDKTAEQILERKL